MTTSLNFVQLWPSCWMMTTVITEPSSKLVLRWCVRILGVRGNPATA